MREIMQVTQHSAEVITKQRRARRQLWFFYSGPNLLSVDLCPLFQTSGARQLVSNSRLSFKYRGVVCGPQCVNVLTSGTDVTSEISPVYILKSPLP